MSVRLIFKMHDFENLGNKQADREEEIPDIFDSCFG